MGRAAHCCVTTYDDAGAATLFDVVGLADGGQGGACSLGEAGRSHRNQSRTPRWCRRSHTIVDLRRKPIFHLPRGVNAGCLLFVTAL